MGRLPIPPDAHFDGVDQFIYRASDGELESAIAVVTITVTGANDAPVADDLTVTTFKNTPLDILLHGNDSDGDPLVFQIVSVPMNGSLSGTANNFSYLNLVRITTFYYVEKCLETPVL